MSSRILDIKYNQSDDVLILGLENSILFYQYYQSCKNNNSDPDIYQLDNIQFQQFIIDSIVITSDQKILHLNLKTGVIKNTIQFNSTQTVTQFNVNKKQDLIIVGFNDGQVLQYNLTSQNYFLYETRKEVSLNISIIIIELIEISDIKLLAYVVSNGALLLQIEMLQQQVIQQIDLRILVNEDPSITLSKFLIDQNYQRYIFCFNGQKKAYIWNYSKNEQERNLSLPKMQSNLKIELNFLLIQCIFQINLYQLNTKIEFVASIKKDFTQDSILDSKLFNNNTIAIFLIDRFELFIINGDKFNMIAQISYQYSRLLNYSIDSQKNVLSILGLHQAGVFENKYNLDIYKSETVSECFFFSSSKDYQNIIEEQTYAAPKQKEIQTINGVSLVNQENQFIYFYLQIPSDNIQNIFLQTSSIANSQQVMAPYDNQNNFIALQNTTFENLSQSTLQITNFSLTFQNNTNLFINITQNKKTQQFIFQNMAIDFECFGTNQIFLSDIQKVVFQNIKISQLNLKKCSNYNQKNSLFFFQNISEIFIYNLEISYNDFYQKSQIPLFQFELIKTVLINGVNIIQNNNLNSLMSFQQIQNLTLENLTVKNNSQQLQINQTQGMFTFLGCNIITLIGSTFEFNNQLVLLFSTNQYSSLNQKIELNDDILVLKNLQVEQNKFLQQQIMFIQSSKIQFNNFTHIENEGSLLLIQSKVVIIEKSYFKFNTAQNGGAIHFQSIQEKIEFKKSLFQQNTAKSSGGALYLENIANCLVLFDSQTIIKNNRALIGGGLRIVQTDQKKLLLPQNFPFSKNIFDNVAEIYGDDSTSYLQNIIIQNNDYTNGELFIFYKHQSNVPKEFQNDYSRYAELRQFRSGGLINFKMYIVDEQNRYLSFSKDKLEQGLYPKDISQEINNIQISFYQLNSSETQMFGQNIINYYQYDSKSQSFMMNDLKILGNLNKVQYFYINSTIQTNSLTINPILLSVQFRNCIKGEVIQQINLNVYQCNQCLEGTYQLNDPQILYQQYIEEKKDTNRCINCPESAVTCKGNIIKLKNGFWRQNNYTDEIIECDPIINSCQAENPSSINYCITGYLGPACQQCDILGEVWKGSRYSESLSKGFCQKCGSQIKQWGFIILKIIILEAYFLYVLGVFIQKFKYTQTCYYLRILKIMPISSNSIQDYSGFYIKIILTYYQLSALLIPQPKIISINFNLFNDIIGSGGVQISLGTDCLISENIIRDMGKILFYTQIQFLVPMAVFILIPFTLMFYQDISKQKLRGYHIFLIFHIIFIFFQVNQISYFTKSLTCKQVGNQLYNPIDLSFDCYDSSIVKYLYPFSVMVLVFWTLFPLVFLRLINQNKKKLDQCIIKYKYGYYYGELKPKYYYWEFVRIYLKISIIYQSQIVLLFQLAYKNVKQQLILLFS
ncbi:transmembrane protein, putative (macronuclear) [Tetrahymena thermophila SB210]|uniref:Transmembrane protein, putative n=1 Tax=Tetrahymena thermophila (strain SB210) TaxID=312017 RepID=W7X844_TETTS|nr:transmembrane protein, putative [Tetrahymena thermophila SB210]EWS75540.1 transmembrane protein, putative [Tetrahymena thermophila SB210]|eukprot:XP_012651925.1 transmembrane protein, putative [Tetrahymena thermophila SB210]